MEECNHCCVDCAYYHGGNKPICSCSSVEKILLTNEEKKTMELEQTSIRAPT
jgi:hypothetical protein